MLKNIRQHETKNITTGATATIQVPAYGKIHNVILNFKKSDGSPVSLADISSEINKIRMTINGIDYVNCTAKQLFTVYGVLGNRVGSSTLDNGTIELNLGRLMFPNGTSGQDLFGIGTADVASIQIQITAGTIVNVDSIEAFTTREPNQKAALGTVAKLIEYPQSFNATGEHTVDTLPRNADEDYLGVIVDKGAGASSVVSFGECTVNAMNILDKTPANVNANVVSSNNFVQPTGDFFYDFSNGTVNDRLPMVNVKDFRLKTTFSTSPGASGYSLLALQLTNVPRTVTK